MTAVLGFGASLVLVRKITEAMDEIHAAGTVVSLAMHQWCVRSDQE